MSTRSPAAILFDVSGNLAVIQSGFPATGTVTGSAPGVMMAGSDGQFARLLKTTTDGTLHVSGAVTTTPTGVQQVTGTVGVTGSVAITHVVPVAVQGQIGVNNFPATQNVSGTVNVGNWPPVVAVTGSQPTGSTHQGSPIVVGGVFTSGSYVKSLYVDVSGALYVTTSGSLPVTGGIQVLNQVQVTGSVHVTNQVLNVTGSLAVDNVVRVTATGSLPVHVDSQVGVNNFPETQRVSGSVATYTQGPQLVSGTVHVTGSVAVYTHGAQNVTGSVNVYTDGPQQVTGSVAVYTQGPQNVTGSVNVYTHGPQAVSGSQLTGSTFHGYPVVVGGVSGSIVQVPAVVDNQPTKSLFGVVTRDIEVVRPTFQAIYDRITMSASKYLATLFNTSSTYKVVIQNIWVYSWQTDPVRGGDNDMALWKISARTAGTTVTPRAEDSLDVLPSGISADTDSTAVTQSFLMMRLLHNGDESIFNSSAWKAALSLEFASRRYERKPGTKGWTLRQNEGMSLQFISGDPDGTVSIIYEFTVEEA